jgi:cytidylate kinase
MASNESLDTLRRLMAARMHEWGHRQENEQPRPGPIVTIEREPGCGGEAIAEKLSVALKLHLYNSEMVEQIAKDAHVSTEVVATLDEKAGSELEEWLATFRGDRSLSSYAYVRTLRKVIFTIASHGNAVIVGRGGNFFLPPEKRIALGLMAPLDVRIGNVMKECGFSEKRAREHIAEVEKEHRRFVKEYFETDIRDPIHYHMIINTALVDAEIIVQIVKQILMPGK